MNVGEAGAGVADHTAAEDVITEDVITDDDGSDGFSVGERVLLVDRKARRNVITLAVGGEFHSHTGVISHDDLLGAPEGTQVRSTRGAAFVAMRPTLADFIVEMPRGAQVIYPKDLGQILMMADIAAGQRVLESGVGSGALSMALLRAGADVTGFELREDFARKAQTNVAAFCGTQVATQRYHVHVHDIYEGVPVGHRAFDRVVLDLPEPWRVVGHAVDALRRGGIFLAYLPTVNQTHTLRRALDEHGFSSAQTVEVMLRTWHVTEQSVRPDHRMVAHTGFLTAARWLGPQEGPVSAPPPPA